jgi:hypothetical protein
MAIGEDIVKRLRLGEKNVPSGVFPDETEEVILAHAESLYQDTQWDDKPSLVNVAPGM